MFSRVLRQWPTIVALVGATIVVYASFSLLRLASITPGVTMAAAQAPQGAAIQDHPRQPACDMMQQECPLDDDQVKQLFQWALQAPFQANPATYGALWALSDPSNHSRMAASFHAICKRFARPLRRGGTLWGMAQKLVGTGYGWSAFAAASHIKDPRTIPAGTPICAPMMT